jgi:PAS domain S-box-containing protein
MPSIRGGMAPSVDAPAPCHHGTQARQQCLLTSATLATKRAGELFPAEVRMREQDEPRATNVPSRDDLIRFVFDSATEFAILSMDSAGLVTSWSPGAERLFGFTETEILGDTADVIFTPEDRTARIPEKERITAARTGRSEDERWHVRRDGSRFWASGVMMKMTDGRGFTKIVRDLTERHLADERVRMSEVRFRLLAANIPQLVFRTGSMGERTWGSPQWLTFTGTGEEESLGLGWLKAVHPDDHEGTLAAWRQAPEVGSYDVEHRIRCAADGEYRWHRTRAAPLDPAEPRRSEWVGTSTDIHELRTLQDRQEMLLKELEHRSRNLLAVIQALAAQTLRSGKEPNEVFGDFQERLQALARVQGLLSQSGNESVAIRSLVDAEFAALAPDAQARVTRSGGLDVVLPGVAAQILALVLHELTTNAVKYGALGQHQAALSVDWRVRTEDGRPVVVIDWTETGVAMPAGGAPQRHGLGRRLIERASPHQLGGEGRFAFAPDGVRCTLKIPLTALGGGQG